MPREVLGAPFYAVASMKRVYIAASLCLSLFSTVAWSQISVTPSSAELSADRRQASFTLTNNTEHTQDVRMRLAPWQPKGFETATDEAKLLDDKALLIYPPVASVSPDAEQVFRIILRDSSVEELALFRVHVSWRQTQSEPSRDGDADTVAFGIGYSMPLMVTAPEAEYELDYRAVQSDGEVLLEVANRGTKPAYVKRYRWADGTQETLFFYAWPGQKRYYKLPVLGPPPVELQLRTFGWTPSVSRDQAASE